MSPFYEIICLMEYNYKICFGNECVFEEGREVRTSSSFSSLPIYNEFKQSILPFQRVMGSLTSESESSESEKNISSKTLVIR